MRKLQVGILQTDIIWSDVAANQNKIEGILYSQKTLPELLILPEAFSTGFIANPSELNRGVLARQLEWMISLSERLNVALMGSVVSPLDKKFVNRMFFTTSDGKYNYYDKRHLFQEERQKGLYVSGSERVVFSMNSVPVFPLICYDLRFPVWARNNLNYQVMVISANWPSQRQEVWRVLLKARALENQCYVIGVNRVGTDENQLNYNGGSMVVGPKGNVMAELGEKEEYRTVELDIEALIEFKDHFPVYKDADTFNIEK